MWCGVWGSMQRQTCYPELPELRPKIDLSVCICLPGHRLHAPRLRNRRMPLACCYLGCVWVLWFIFLHSLWLFHFSFLRLLSPQSFRPNKMLINDELSMTNHCLLFPTVPLFVRFTFQKQLNQRKIKIYIKQYKAGVGGRGERDFEKEIICCL